MSDKGNCWVAAIGVAPNEQQVLKNIFKLSYYRTRSYAFTEVLTDAKILMINADDKNGLVKYHTLRAQNVIDNRVPIVMIGGAPTSDSRNHSIRRPFVATRVLRVLDQATSKAFQSAPGYRIGDEGKVPDQTELQNLPLAAGPKLKNYKALVVDDSIAVRKLMDLELGYLGIEGDFADTAQAAFELLDKRTYDIIFLDVVLPDIDGYKICKTIKKNKATSKIPVLFVTGRCSALERVRGKLAGCDSYITKPTSSEVFRDAVKQYLPLKFGVGRQRKSEAFPTSNELVQVAELS